MPANTHFFMNTINEKVNEAAASGQAGASTHSPHNEEQAKMS